MVSLINFLSQPQSLISLSSQCPRSAVVNIAAGKCRWRGVRQHCRRRWCHTGFRLAILGQITQMPSPHVSSGHSGYILTQFCKNVSQPTGFEPVRGDPIGFRVQRLNHSATTAALSGGDNVNYGLSPDSTRGRELSIAGVSSSFLINRGVCRVSILHTEQRYFILCCRH